jgi:hypothetical protein
MRKRNCLLVGILLLSTNVFAQSDSVRIVSSNRSWKVKSAIEVESLVPMFITGGFHVGLGYRFDRFRVRVSVINGGSYDAEKAGIKNSSDAFERHYKTSPGVFFGYNLWRNLELYSYLEFHTFEIEQKSTGIKKDLHSKDTGLGISYQFFIGKTVYIQPGLHLYVRKDKSIDFETARYSIPTVDFSPVVRLGVRLWSTSK